MRQQTTNGGHGSGYGTSADPRRSIALLSDEGAPQIKKFLGQPAQPNHIVQFYDTDDFLCENVTHFIAAGVASGEPTVVIATAAHRAEFARRLEHNAIDVSRARGMGLYVELDAEEMLGKFVTGSLPDPTRFQTLFGGVITAAQAMRPECRVRAYGEMVDLLMRAGNRQGALRLEELWSELGDRMPFSLLCAYGMQNFSEASSTDDFAAICRGHSHVIPAEGYSELRDGGARLREITMLQQRATALEYEVARRKELEGELRESLLREMGARAEAERTVKYNELFAGMLGHDLRNPLNAILTTAHYIARSSEEAKTTAAAARIASSSQRMARMIEQLLDFTKIRVGEGLTPARIPLDLAQLCTGIKSELESAHPDSRITITSRGDHAGELDFDRMLQVLSNVMGNAVHHGPTGGTVTVDIDGSHPDRLVVAIANEGIVAAEVMPVLFEPFRAGSKGQHSRGLGLGLYITHQIVAAHGGNIAVATGHDAGTTFRITLPRTGACSLN